MHENEFDCDTYVPTTTITTTIVLLGLAGYNAER